MYWRFSRNDRLRHVTLQLWYYFLEGFAVAEDMLLTVQQLSGCVEITTNQKAEIVELEFVGCCLLRGSVLISDDVPACICGVFCLFYVVNFCLVFMHFCFCSESGIRSKPVNISVSRALISPLCCCTANVTDFVCTYSWHGKLTFAVNVCIYNYMYV